MRIKRPNKRERKEIIRQRAFEFGASGKYSSWYHIEHALRQQGLSEARQELDNRMLRAQLNDICKRAQAGEFREVDE